MEKCRSKLVLFVLWPTRSKDLYTSHIIPVYPYRVQRFFFCIHVFYVTRKFLDDTQGYLQSA